MYAEAAAGQLALGQVDPARGYLDDIQKTAQESLAGMRLLIYELRPPMLEHEGLVAALQNRLYSVENRAGMKFSLKSNLDERLPASVEDGLFRIAHEALNNTLKHAHAGNIQVSILREGSIVTMEILDDGIGFDPVQISQVGCLGIVSMRERAFAQGWQFDIEGRPGAGTRVRRGGEDMTNDGGTGPFRVLAVDDHAIIRKGMKAVLDLIPDIEMVGEAENGTQALEMDLVLKPDVVLMDLMMPGMDGITCIREIKSRRPDARILVLTNFAGEEMIFPAIQSWRNGLSPQGFQPGGACGCHPPGVSWGIRPYTPSLQRRCSMNFMPHPKGSFQQSP